MKLAVGVDIGGTKISIVLGNSRGRILKHELMPTRTGRETAGCIRTLTEKIVEFTSARKGVQGIGICLPGAVDSRKGVVPVSPHLKGWQGIALGRRIASKTGLPVYLANDANAAAVAEKIFGCARKAENFIYMTVSTGVGGGIFANGRILEGASFVAGEIGHMTLEPDGVPWELNEQGVLEAYSSGTAIARFAASEIRRGRGSARLKKAAREGRLDAREIAMAARAGDRFAIAVYRRAGEYLGLGIGNLLNILNPELVILGGGVWKSAPPVLMQSLKATCRKRSWPQAWKAVKIVRTSLGDHVGNLGAMALVFAAK